MAGLLELLSLNKKKCQTLILYSTSITSSLVYSRQLTTTVNRTVADGVDDNDDFHYCMAFFCPSPTEISNKP